MGGGNSSRTCMGLRDEFRGVGTSFEGSGRVKGTSLSPYVVTTGQVDELFPMWRRDDHRNEEETLASAQTQRRHVVGNQRHVDPSATDRLQPVALPRALARQ